MLPGEIDTSFQAHCPLCGGREWKFRGLDGLKMTVDPDSRECARKIPSTTSVSDVPCGYIHFLRGGPVGGPPPTRVASYSEPKENAFAKRSRIRKLVLKMIGRNDIFFHSDKESMLRTASECVKLAIAIDDEIESIK